MVINICVDQKKTCVYVCVLNLVQLFSTPCAVACEAPLSVGFSRQEYWDGLLVPSPKDLSDPGIKPTSPASPALVDGFFTIEPPGKCKTIKLGANLDDIGFGNDFLDRTPKAQSMKKKEAGLH